MYMIYVISDMWLTKYSWERPASISSNQSKPFDKRHVTCSESSTFRHFRLKNLNEVLKTLVYKVFHISSTFYGWANRKRPWWENWSNGKTCCQGSTIRQTVKPWQRPKKSITDWRVTRTWPSVDPWILLNSINSYFMKGRNQQMSNYSLLVAL